MQNVNSSSSGSEKSSTKKMPHVSGFSHVSIPCRDVEEAIRFFTEVLGAEFLFHSGGFAEVRIGGISFGFSKLNGGWTGHSAEYPHYAFFIEAEDLLPMKERLESYRVPTNQLWSRDGVKVVMYFRDPSGNLFELYCGKDFKDAATVARAGADGNYMFDLGALNYDWKS